MILILRFLRYEFRGLTAYLYGLSECLEPGGSNAARLRGVARASRP